MSGVRPPAGPAAHPVHLDRLVRDKIPQIIAKSGKSYETKILSKGEYIEEVRKKMHEELQEYEEAQTNKEAVEELADLMELIYAAAGVHGSTAKELESIRAEKAAKRGAFEEKVFLIEVEDE